MTDYLTNPALLGMPAGGAADGGFGGSDESPKVSYTLRVNGLERPVDGAWIGESLLYVLRERLGLAGAKGGCDQGECGACSVQLDGQLTAACLVPAALAADSEIRTVEGLSADGGPSDVQRALAESGAVQCGYCVPGLAMAVHDLLERNHRPSELQAREALCGNLCRCTGYSGALAAVQTVARAREAATALSAAAAAEAASLAEVVSEAASEAAAAAVPVPFEPDASFASEAPFEPGASFGPVAELPVEAPVEHEQPVYLELPAQQAADPLFGPMDGVAAPAPQYAGYYEQGADYPPGVTYEQGVDYGAGQYAEYPQGEYPQPGVVHTSEPEPGVYVLPHQQQHTHAPAPEA